MQRITYYLNGHSLNDTGIVVKAATGLIELPDLKERKKGDWKAMNGVVLDTARPFMKERSIKLECAWLIQPGAAIGNVQDAQKYVRETLLNYGQSVRLMVQFPTAVLNKPLVYNVVQDKGVSFSWKYSGNDTLLQFTITLTEPQPCKMVLITDPDTDEATVKFSVADSTTQFDIDWGDGTIDYDVRGTGTSTYIVNKSHTYATAGTYYIVVSGDIYQAGSVDTNNTNVTVLWTIK